MLAAEHPDAATRRFAALFRAVGADDPVGDPVDYRLPFATAPVEYAAPATAALTPLFDSECSTVRQRAIREARVAVEQDPTIGARLIEPLAEQLPDIDEKCTQGIVDAFEQIDCREERPDLVGPVLPSLFEVVAEYGDDRRVGQIIRAVGEEDLDRARRIATTYDDPEQRPSAVRNAVLDSVGESDSPG